MAKWLFIHERRKLFNPLSSCSIADVVLAWVLWFLHILYLFSLLKLKLVYLEKTCFIGSCNLKSMGRQGIEWTSDVVRLCWDFFFQLDILFWYNCCVNLLFSCGKNVATSFHRVYIRKYICIVNALISPKLKDVNWSSRVTCPPLVEKGRFWLEAI